GCSCHLGVQRSLLPLACLIPFRYLARVCHFPGTLRGKSRAGTSVLGAGGPPRVFGPAGSLGTFRTTDIPVNSGILYVRIIDRPFAGRVPGPGRPPRLFETALENARTA